MLEFISVLPAYIYAVYSRINIQNKIHASSNNSSTTINLNLISTNCLTSHMWFNTIINTTTNIQESPQLTPANLGCSSCIIDSDQ